MLISFPIYFVENQNILSMQIARFATKKYTCHYTANIVTDFFVAPIVYHSTIIVKILKTVALDEKLVQKTFYDLD